MKKLLVISTMLCASLLHAQIRFTQVTPATDQIKIKNFGASDVDISTYRLCALFNYATLSFAPVSIVSGDFLLSQNEVVTLTWPGLNNTQSDLGLYLPTGLFTSPAAMVDFMQYGAAGQGREGVADAAGIWTAGTFLTGTGPWFYIGDGNTTGVTEWMSLPVNVTFSVDMQDQIISPDGVHITGSFQGWTPGTTEMTDVDMDNVYTITLSLAQGDYQYKFINGNDWPGQEIVPMACGVDDGFGGYNREVVVSALPITTPLVCFGSCTVCPPDPVYVEVTFSVDMNNQTVSGDGVHLAGSFQGWDPAATSMSDGDADGIYTVTILVDENTDIEFKYVNGNAWGADEIVPAECAQNNNRFASIGNGDTMLGVVCFAECDACPIIVDPVFVDVTFQVNMQDETVSANGVYVTGTFNGWSATATPLNDGDADNVYAITVLIEENTQIEFKYLNGDDFAGAETVPALCGVDDGFGGLNRIADIGVIAAVLDTVCFSSCMNCNEIIVVPTNMITLQVNMQDQTVSMDGVHVAGNFQGWNPATTEMTDVDMDGIYTVTFEADEWANLSYKFINGNDWPQAEEVPSTCGLPDGNGGYNRILETGSNDVSANVVCFGECDDCEPIIEPVMVNITFSVNMQNETVDANGVHIAGSLQGWDPASTMMTDVDMDGIYTVTLEVEENTTVQYRFINGNDWP
ncbi:MAG: hypothetical protein ACKVOR_09455, partial [Flavobacteriales bacterium]